MCLPRMRIFAWLGRLRAPLAGLALGLLAGCATPLATQVSRFNAWRPELAQATFAFLRAPDPTRELEQLSYEALVEAELQRLGLRRAGPGEAARLQVDMALDAQLQVRPYLRPIYQDLPVWRPGWRDAAGRIHPGYWGPDPFGPRLVGHQQVQATVQVSSLRLRLLESAGPGPATAVFEATARHEAEGSPALPQIAPWLVRSVFTDFPGRSGQVIELRFDAKTGERLKPR